MTRASKIPGTLSEWRELGEKRLRNILRRVAATPGLVKLGPIRRIDLQMVGSAAMLKLNRGYRGKAYATDVLSFPAPEPIRRLGFPGELVICVPKLRSQAREHAHSPEIELDVLLVHGVLHLLGFDHELGPQAAAKMAAAEKKLMGRGPSPGLIRRSQSGKRYGYGG